MTYLRIFRYRYTGDTFYLASLLYLTFCKCGKCMIQIISNEENVSLDS